MKFIRENWMWIVIPILVVTLVAYLVYANMGDADPEFAYPL